MQKHISTLLQEIKRHTDWSEKRIASEIGCSQPTVNRILKGQDDCTGKTLSAITALHLRLFPDGVVPEPTDRQPGGKTADRQAPQTWGRLPLKVDRMT